jgi:sugar phosphate isomerase/epimerase
VRKGLAHVRKLRVSLALENIEVKPLGSVIEFVRGLDEPDLTLALDIGHAYLSEPYLGGDFLQSIAEAAPMTGHIHLSDNFCRFAPMGLQNFDLYRVSNYTNRLNRGTGDLNLPAGCGTVPLEQVLPLFAGYRGILVLEYYHDKYLEFNVEIAAEARALLSRFLGTVS